MVVVGRNNLTVFEPTSIGSVLVKEGGSPTTSRLARLALAGSDDISTPRLPNSTFYFDEGDKFLMLVVPFCFLNNPFLTGKFDYDWKCLVVQNPVVSLLVSEIISGSSGGCHVCCLCVSLPG